MMRYIKYWYLTFFAFCTLSTAATPEQVEKECERQMSLGICFSNTEPSNVPTKKTITISGAGRVSYSAYLDYIKKYNPKNPKDLSMCKLALFHMQTNAGGDHDKIARAMWSPQEMKPILKK